jgi:Na+-transporting NADH:ubiquinone oxidoreductase subunit C
VAFAVSAVCAALVTGATAILRPIQAENRAAEERVRLEALLAAIPGMEPVLAEAGGAALGTVVVELGTGRAASVPPDALEAALADPANWTELPPEADVAGIGARPDLAQVYLVRDAEDVALTVLPVLGSGYNGPIRAMLALRGDGNTIAGLAVTDHSETPGLGGRIDERDWLRRFPGTELRDPSGELRFAVTRGPAATEYEVDGITGATRTSNAITRMVRFWVGPEGYGPFLDAVRRGEF